LNDGTGEAKATLRSLTWCPGLNRQSRPMSVCYRKEGIATGIAAIFAEADMSARLPAPQIEKI
jgi:hypothetical protein